MDYIDLQSIRKYNYKGIVTLILDKFNEVKNNPQFKVYEHAFTNNRISERKLTSVWIKNESYITLYYTVEGILYSVIISSSNKEYTFNYNQSSDFWKVNTFPYNIDSIVGIISGVYDILVKFSNFSREG